MICWLWVAFSMSHTGGSSATDIIEVNCEPLGVFEAIVNSDFGVLRSVLGTG